MMTLVYTPFSCLSTYSHFDHVPLTYSQALWHVGDDEIPESEKEEVAYNIRNTLPRSLNFNAV